MPKRISPPRAPRRLGIQPLKRRGRSCTLRSARRRLR